MSHRAAILTALATMQAATGRTVIYARGAAQATLTAIPGRSIFDVLADQPELRQVARTHDWLVPVAALTLDEGTTYTEPAEGDTILDVDPTTGLNLTYTVVAPMGMSPWQYGNQYRTHYRIHTILTGSAPPD
jgi:hypothetical protein